MAHFKGMVTVAFAMLVAVSSAQLTAGNLVVTIIGDGGDTAGNLPVSLREYTTTGVQVGSDFSLVGVSGRNLTLTYGENSEGQLSRTPNGQYLTLGGYDLEPRSASFDTFNTLRTAVRVDKDLNAVWSVGFDPEVGDGLRCVYSEDGDWFIGTGGDIGLLTGTFGGPVTQNMASLPLSSRTVLKYNGEFYFTGSNAYSGVNGVAKWDGVSPTPVDVLPTPGGGSGRDLSFIDDDELYLSASTSGVGLVKFQKLAGVWVEQYRLSGRGLTSFVIGPTSGGITTVYVLSSDGRDLMRTEDNGTSFSALTVLASAPASSRFRGLEYAPVAATAKVSGTIDFGLAVLPTTVSMQFRDHGTLNPIGSPINVVVNADGSFLVDAPAKANFDLTVKPKAHLRRTVQADTTGGDVVGLSFAVVGGDIDGDNLITLIDYDIFSDYYDRSSSDSDWLTVGTNGYAPVDADIDYDGSVSLLDYDIFSAGFDQVGDM